MNRSLHRTRRGVALVEFAAAAGLLMLILLGVIEFGLLFKDLLILHETARVGARSAALGDTTTDIVTRVRNSALTLDSSSLTVTLTYSTDDGATFSHTLADSGSHNNAPVGSLIKVVVEYPHPYITGFVIPGQQSKTLVAAMVAQREYVPGTSSGGGGGGGGVGGGGGGRGGGGRGGGGRGGGRGGGILPPIPIRPPIRPF